MADATANLSVTKAQLLPWWLPLIQGIAAVIIGLMLIFMPVKTTVVLVLFLGWWWLISGIFEIASIFVDRTAWGWRLFTGLLSFLAGAYIIGAPLVGAAVVVGVATLMLGINGMIIGIADIFKATQGAGWGTGALGVLSLVFGIVIAFNFTSFMAALPWVWGIFAVVAGIMAIVGSLQLRKVQKA